MSKYKYYLKKPKSEIAKDIIHWLLIAGAVGVAATSPYFGVNAWRSFQEMRRQKKYPKRKFSDTFTRLLRKKAIYLERKGREVKISLTPAGRKIAGYMQIDSLEIETPAEWDRKWRIVLFDINQLKLIRRNAFRSKLKELGFAFLQKSVWLHPFECRDEINLLKDFFELSDKEVFMITTENIPLEDNFKKYFNL